MLSLFASSTDFREPPKTRTSFSGNSGAVLIPQKGKVFNFALRAAPSMMEGNRGFGGGEASAEP